MIISDTCFCEDKYNPYYISIHFDLIPLKRLENGPFSLHVGTCSQCVGLFIPWLLCLFHLAPLSFRLFLYLCPPMLSVCAFVPLLENNSKHLKSGGQEENSENIKAPFAFIQQSLS